MQEIPEIFGESYNPEEVKGVEINSGKFDYLFGRASGEKNQAHNRPRTAQNLTQMSRLGVYDNSEGRALLTQHLSEVVKDPSNVISKWSNSHGKFEDRESLFAGPSGKFAKFKSTFQIMEDGARRLTTIIPKGGPRL